MVRVQTISPRPQFNNFSGDTVPLNSYQTVYKKYITSLTHLPLQSKMVKKLVFRIGKPRNDENQYVSQNIKCFEKLKKEDKKHSF